MPYYKDMANNNQATTKQEELARLKAKYARLDALGE